MEWEWYHSLTLFVAVVLAIVTVVYFVNKFGFKRPRSWMWLVRKRLYLVHGVSGLILGHRYAMVTDTTRQEPPFMIILPKEPPVSPGQIIYRDYWHNRLLLFTVDAPVVVQKVTPSSV